MNQLSLLFLINRLQLSCLCLSAFSLLACEPYEKCDESLKVGDELTFKLTAGPSEQEQIDECGASLPSLAGVSSSPQDTIKAENEAARMVNG